MEPVRLEFCRLDITPYKNHIKNPIFLINLDETAVYFNSPLTRTVHTKGEKTVSSNIQGSSLRVTVAVPITMNGKKTTDFCRIQGETTKIRRKIFIKHLSERNRCLCAKKWMDG